MISVKKLPSGQGPWSWWRRASSLSMLLWKRPWKVIRTDGMLSPSYSKATWISYWELVNMKIGTRGETMCSPIITYYIAHWGFPSSLFSLSTLKTLCLWICTSLLSPVLSPLQPDLRQEKMSINRLMFVSNVLFHASKFTSNFSMIGKRSCFHLCSLIYREIIFFHVILFHWQFVALPIFPTRYLLPSLLCKSY